MIVYQIRVVAVWSAAAVARGDNAGQRGPLPATPGQPAGR
jgi:hypothetical protein